MKRANKLLACLIGLSLFSVVHAGDRAKISKHSHIEVSKKENPAFIVIKEFDLNKDKHLDLYEILKSEAKMFSLIDLNNDNNITLEELNKKMPWVNAPEVIKILDFDQTGSISKIEFLDNSAESFDKIDLNKDGKISFSELDLFTDQLYQYHLIRDNKNRDHQCE